MTQAELAMRMGKTQTYVARVEGGKHDPRWATVLEFARALEMEPALISRESIPAASAVLNLTSTDEVPPFAGEAW
ncbi:MAG: helix-turn-helix domain-containing protein [Candidatus Eremiobacteraeota bacterium]|nr:helix-turn-helix domain-containing protein [Candidatus Eremiobacteraeota bacterium]MBC5802632.1 helix-turn-helix domain-containing protein [Candidatus Eremiobacteraeota bacterium]MBC5820966.1 helix-turn-helix domain-containing protein [Candidatus Eremiobacteraeota bacterium]